MLSMVLTKIQYFSVCLLLNAPAIPKSESDQCLRMATLVCFIFNFRNLLLSEIIKNTDDQGRFNYFSNNYYIYYYRQRRYKQHWFKISRNLQGNFCVIKVMTYNLLYKNNSIHDILKICVKNISLTQHIVRTKRWIKKTIGTLFSKFINDTKQKINTFLI